MEDNTRVTIAYFLFKFWLPDSCVLGIMEATEIRHEYLDLNKGSEVK